MHAPWPQRAPALTAPGRDWLARATGLNPAWLRLTGMRGATSSSLYLVQGPSGVRGRRFVLRLFTLQDWLAAEPDLARHEAAALAVAAGSGVAVPALVDYLPGPSSEHPEDPVGFGSPAVLMTHLPGRVELTPRSEERWTWLLAETLAAVHSTPAPSFGWRYRSWVEPANVTVPLYASDTALWEAAAHAYSRWRPAQADGTFLHRDYHAMNVLFAGHGSGLEVTGVVDWVNACLGPAAADVSHCRMDLVKMKGVEASERFLESYRQLRPEFEYDPVWDLEGAFDVAVPAANAHGPWREFGLGALTPATVQARVEEHVRRALVNLGKG